MGSQDANKGPTQKMGGDCISNEGEGEGLGWHWVRILAQKGGA